MQGAVHRSRHTYHRRGLKKVPWVSFFRCLRNLWVVFGRLVQLYVFCQGRALDVLMWCVFCLLDFALYCCSSLVLLEVLGSSSRLVDSSHLYSLFNISEPEGTKFMSALTYVKRRNGIDGSNRSAFPFFSIGYYIFIQKR